MQEPALQRSPTSTEKIIEEQHEISKLFTLDQINKLLAMKLSPEDQVKVDTLLKRIPLAPNAKLQSGALVDGQYLLIRNRTMGEPKIHDSTPVDPKDTRINYIEIYLIPKALNQPSLKAELHVWKGGEDINLLTGSTFSDYNGIEAAIKRRDPAWDNYGLSLERNAIGSRIGRVLASVLNK